MLRSTTAFLCRDLWIARNYRLALALEAAEVILTVTAFFFLGKLVGNQLRTLGPYPNYFAYVLLGIATSNFFFISLNRFAQSVRDAQLSGTLPMLFLMRPSPAVLFASSHLASQLAQLLRLVAYLLVGWLAFGFWPNLTAWGASALLLALGMIMFIGIALCSASFILLFKRGDPLNWALSLAGWVVSGVMFPIELLPRWLRSLSAFFPLTWVLSGLRKTTLLGQGIRGVLPEIAWISAMTTLLLVAGVLTLNLAVRRAQREGSLSHY